MGEAKMKRIKGLVVACSLMMIFPTIVQAFSDEFLSFFKPYITFQEEYDSNIDLRQNNVRGDFITTITPGIKFSTQPKSPVTGEFLQVPTAERRYGMDLDFNVGFNFYAKNHEENYISLNGLLNAWYALTKNLNFRVRDYLIRSDDIREQDYSPTAIPGEYLPSRTLTKVVWLRNVFSPSLQYQFGRENAFTVNYTNNYYNVQSSLYEDSLENTINPRIDYWFDIRNGISLGYTFTYVDYQSSPSVMVNIANGRYTYRFNPRTSAYLNYTQTWVDNGLPRPDYVVYNPTIGMELTFSRTLSGIAEVGYYLADPDRGSSLNAPSFKFSLTQKEKKTTYTILIDGGYTLDFTSPTGSERGFTQYYRVIGNINYQLLQKMNVGVSGSYEWEKWPRTELEERGQKNNIWEIGANASYELFKWLRFSLQFYYTQNNSNISSFDYTDYRAIFRATASF
jgi:hypothetical protein